MKEHRFCLSDSGAVPQVTSLSFWQTGRYTRQMLLGKRGLVDSAKNRSSRQHKQAFTLCDPPPPPHTHTHTHTGEVRLCFPRRSRLPTASMRRSLVLFFAADLGPDAYATVVLSGRAAGVRNNGTVGVRLGKVRWVQFPSLQKRNNEVHGPWFPWGV